MKRGCACFDTPSCFSVRHSRLYYSPLPEKQFVGYGHQCSLHVALQFRYKLYAIHKEPFEKTLDMPTMSQKPITENLIERAMSFAK